MTAEQLRNSILQEAISGRLVPQDPNDEPAEIVSTVPEDESPFELPTTWKWVRMQDVLEFVNGRAYKKEELLSQGKYRVLRVGNFFTNQSWYYSDLELPEDKYCYNGDLLYAWSASFGPRIWEGEKTIFHYHIWNVKFEKDILFREYLYYFFLYDKSQVKKSTTGSTMIHVSMENMKPRLLPLPPLAEQKRIVAKLEELLPIVEQYGKAQTELDELNAALPARLRQSILQEAISGRLVPQDPNDEPASVLLQHIREEKARLVKAKQISKRDFEVLPITEDDVDYEIPTSWEWVRLGDIFKHSTGKALNEANKKGTLQDYITTSNVYWGYFKLDKLRQMYYTEDEKEKCMATKGDLLVLEGGDVGRAAIWDRDYDIFLQNHIHKLRAYVPVCTEFYYYCLYLFHDMGLVGGKGIGIQGLSSGALHQIIFPLPPLAEQQRIVAKIEELFEQIDKITK